MDKIYYNLLKNYGWNETKLEVVLFTLLKENKKFKKAFLSEAFNSKFDYASAVIEMEVSRRSLRKGRTDVEVTDKNGFKYILELKVGFAYPSDKQIQMYESIDKCKEVATLTNVTALPGVRKHKNITWAETAQVIKNCIGDGPIFNFINDFGPTNGKGRKIIQPFDLDTYFNFISNKPGNFMNGHHGLDVLKNYGYYTMPGPGATNATGYAKVTEKSEVKYLAFKWKESNTPRGMNNYQVFEIVESSIVLPDEFNEKAGEDLLWNKASGDKYMGPHQIFKLKPATKERYMKSPKQGMLRFYGSSTIMLEEKYDDIQKLRDAVKADIKKDK